MPGTHTAEAVALFFLMLVPLRELNRLILPVLVKCKLDSTATSKGLAALEGKLCGNEAVWNRKDPGRRTHLSSSSPAAAL